MDTKQIACPPAGLSADLFPVCLLLNYKLSENTEGNDCNSSIMFTKGKCENQLRMRGYMKNIKCISSNICSYKNYKVHIQRCGTDHISSVEDGYQLGCWKGNHH